MSLRSQVAAFHRAFGVPSRETPGIPDEATVRLRMRLVAEECIEMLEACVDDPAAIAGVRIAIDDVTGGSPLRVDLVALADALGDIDYVVTGSRLALGFDGAPIADAIHAANMAKLGPDGRPMVRADGKITKPDGWVGPEAEIARALKAQGWRP